jgi:hypothetical protein
VRPHRPSYLLNSVHALLIPVTTGAYTISTTVLLNDSKYGRHCRHLWSRSSEEKITHTARREPRTFILEMTASNIGRDADCPPWGFLNFPQSPPGKKYPDSGHHFSFSFFATYRCILRYTVKATDGVIKKPWIKKRINKCKSMMLLVFVCVCPLVKLVVFNLGYTYKISFGGKRKHLTEYVKLKKK